MESCIFNFIRLLDTRMVLTDFEFVIQNDEFVHNGNTYRVEGSDVVSLDRSCPFFAGTVFDFLAFVESSYEIAVEAIFDSYEEQIIKTFAIDTTTLRNRFIFELKQHRYVLNLLIQHRNSWYSQPLTAKTTKIRNWYDRHDIKIQNIKGSVFLLNTEQYLDLVGRTMPLVKGMKNVPRIEAPYPSYMCVVPFFASKGVISHYYLQDPLRKKSYRLECLPSRLAFSGLWDYNEGPVVVCDDLVQALRTNSQDQIMTTKYYWMSLELKQTAPLIEPPVSKVIYNLDQSGSLDKASHVEQYFKVFRVAQDITGIHFTWLNYLKSILSSDISPNKLVNIFKGIHLNPDVRLHLIDNIDNPEIKKLLQLDADYHVRNVVIHKTDEGYDITNKTMIRSKVTNFTVELSDTIHCKKATWHRGVVHFEDKTHPITLKRTDISSGRAIEMAVQLAVLKNGGGKGLPIVYDKRGAQNLSILLNTQTETLPTKDGISYLGWNDSFTEYKGPFFNVSELGVSYTSSMCDPAEVMLNKFNYAHKDDLEGALRYIPKNLKALNDSIETSIQNYIKGVHNEPILVSNDTDTTRTLTRYFSKLGQENPIQVAMPIGLPEAKKIMSHVTLFSTHNDKNLGKLLLSPIVILSPNGKLKVNSKSDKNITLAVYDLIRRIRKIAKSNKPK